MTHSSLQRRHKNWSQQWYLSCMALWLSLAASSTNIVVAKKPVPAAATESALARDLRDFCSARCNDNMALWVYQGALFDPLEGRKIANVQGLELVKCIASVNGQHKQQQQNQWGDLEVAPLLSHPNATFDHASTLLSRKLFCYQAPDNSQELLRQIKLRPTAPQRRIPTKQALVVYDTVTTFIARGANNLIAHTEWPDGQSIWGMATTSRTTASSTDANDDKNNPSLMDAKKSQQSTKSFDFTIFARQKSARKKPEELFDLTTPPPTAMVDDANNKHTNSSQSNAAVVATSPQRSKLIEFGTGSSRGKDKFGARETYAYSNIPSSLLPPPRSRRDWFRRGSPVPSLPSPQVRYSRYGEGPPFVGPGRICTLELQGRRVSSLDDLPPLLSSVIGEHLPPQFLTSLYDTTDINANEDNAAKAQQPLQWFRSTNRNNQLRPAIDEPNDFWLPDYLRERGKTAWANIRPKLFGRQPHQHSKK